MNLKININKQGGSQGREKDWLTATSLYSLAARPGELNLPDDPGGEGEACSGGRHNILYIQHISSILIRKKSPKKKT